MSQDPLSYPNGTAMIKKDCYNHSVPIVFSMDLK